MPVQKKELDQTVLEAARERADYLFEHYDHIFVAHSAGKDSTSAFNVIMDAWERHDGHTNPIKIVHNCTEFKYPEERDYFDRIWRRYEDEVYTYWAVMPVLKSLMVNNEETWRFPYDERDADRWVHDIPTFEEYPNVELVRPDHPFMENFKIGWMHSDVSHAIMRQFAEHEAPEDDPKIVNVTGLRAQESLDRYGAITTLGGFLSENDDKVWDAAHIVYDWTARDIWKIHNEHGWDYNHAYDKMHQLGYTPTQARNGPMWGPYPVGARDAYNIRNFYPELFEKAERRFEGCHLSFEFGTELFKPDKPDDETWREFAARVVNSFDEDEQDHYVSSIENKMDLHMQHASRSFDDTSPCPHCGESWKSIAEYLYGRLNEHYKEVH